MASPSNGLEGAGIVHIGESGTFAAGERRCLRIRPTRQTSGMGWRASSGSRTGNHVT